MSKSLEEALQVIISNGYLVGDIRRQMNESEMINYYRRDHMSAYRVNDPEESTDVYFTSFEGRDAPPMWNPAWLSVGRVFKLTVGQRDALKNIFFTTIYPEATIGGLDVVDGYVHGITLRFPQKSKLTKCHLGEDDFYRWVSQSKLIDQERSEAQTLKDEASPKVKKASKRDKAIQALIDSGIL